MDAISLWTGPERRMALVFGLFLAILSGLLLITWRVRAVVRKRMRKQQRTNRNLQRKLAKAIGERDVLNREVHHRVKNNLQVVSSLLNLQAQRITDGAARAEFIRGKRRIDAMALVHHKLYGMPDLRSIRLQDLFQQLADAVAGLHEPASRSVSHAVDTGGIASDPDTAIELGIILCELLDNCHQHAFPFATGGHIDVEVRALGGDLFRLEVRDNGKGLGENDLKDPSKLGLEIVDALAGQLDGTFTTRPRGNAPGTVFEVRFHKRPPQG
jgi:two-component sensor histidine kinase